MDKKNKVLGIFNFGDIPSESYLLVTPDSLDQLIFEMQDAKAKYDQDKLNNIPISRELFLDNSETIIHYISFKEQIEPDYVEESKETLKDKITKFIIIGLLISIPILWVIGAYTIFTWFL